MSEFLTDLEVELVSDSTNSGRGTWRLLAPLVYQSDVLAETLAVPAGFETDFASVPRSPVVFLLTADTAHAASAIHDMLYSAPHTTSREMADYILQEASIVSGVPAWRAALMFYGVRVFGGAHWGPDPVAPQAK